MNWKGIPPAECLLAFNTDALLDLVTQQWGNPGSTQTYLFTIGPIYGGWQFNVTRSWDHWMDCGLEYHFSGATHREALIAFLKYVRDNQIDVAELAKEE